MTKMTTKQKLMRKRGKQAPEPRDDARGRRTIDPSGEKMKVHHVRATDAQWARYHARGGIGAFREWLGEDDDN